ncbi:MAG: NADAR family protein [Myxococcota bacterium]
MTHPDILHETERFVFFWKPPAPYSQWTMSRFTVDGVSYTCAEQFMMAEKARLFQDDAVRRQILATADPRQQRKLGRKVRGFVETVWVAQREDVVYRASLAKFRQNNTLRAALLGTGDLILVEASPYDRIWGIGLHSVDPRAEDPAQWQGLNLLGKTLMRARATLRNP